MKKMNVKPKPNNDIDEEVKNIVNDMKELKTDSKNIIYVFFNYLKADKMYFFTFLVTLSFLGFISTRNIDFNIEKKHVDSLTHLVEVPDVPELSISDYVGIYSRDVKLDIPIKLNDVCVLDSYKVVYQVNKDNTIKKYFYDSCVGSILISSEVLDYMFNGSNKFIGTEYHSYQFGTNSIKEVDGFTYYIDDDLFSIKESIKHSDIEVKFYGDSIVFLTPNDLILSNGNYISSISSIYNNVGGNLGVRFYNSKTKHQYNFIVFNGFDENLCSDQNLSDELGYTIYSIRYDVNSNNFLEAKEVVSRTKSDGCLYYLEDLKKLEE